VVSSDDERLPPSGIAPDETSSSTEAAHAWTCQQLDHCVPWHCEQDVSKMASTFV
jgi:hypothetical protein